LAEDKKSPPPDLRYLSMMSSLPDASGRLRQSIERRKLETDRLLDEQKILLESLPDVLLIIDEKQNVVRTNRAGRLLFGQGLAGRKLKQVVGNDILLNAVAAVIEDHHDRRVEFHLGEPHSLDMRAVIERFSTPATGAVSVAITLNDVTELKRVQK